MKLDIDDEFEDYMRSVNPTVSPTSVQYSERRRVFFSGAASTFFFLTKIADKASEDEGVKALEDLKRQLLEFAHKRVGFSD